MRVADSWRHVDGRVRRLDLHRERFTRSVALREPALDVAAMVDAAAGVIPAVGEWVPRVRLVGDTLYLDIRRGPCRHPSASVRVLPKGDPRSNPLVKGPDLALAAGLIATARETGADEVLLRSASGRVLEAGHAAVVWWDEDALCVPSAGLPVLPSVTRRLVEERARGLGLEVRRVSAELSDLDGCEAWLLNAYQGLRLVTAWLGEDTITPGVGRRFQSWRAALDAALDPVGNRRPAHG